MKIPSRSCCMVTVLPDGTYDVFVVDATPHGDAITLDLTILAGPSKGEVVSVHATGLRGNELDLLGLPGTLTVVDGVPSVRLE